MENAAHTAPYYLMHAAECEHLADEAVTENNRQMLQKLAASWRLLARRERSASSAAERRKNRQSAVANCLRGAAPPTS